MVNGPCQTYSSNFTNDLLIIGYLENFEYDKHDFVTFELSRYPLLYTGKHESFQDIH
jgi:hypothetical protein